jgi:hypothetical protein
MVDLMAMNLIVLFLRCGLVFFFVNRLAWQLGRSKHRRETMLPYLGLLILAKSLGNR